MIIEKINVKNVGLTLMMMANLKSVMETVRKSHSSLMTNSAEVMVSF